MEVRWLQEATVPPYSYPIYPIVNKQSTKYALTIVVSRHRPLAILVQSTILLKTGEKLLWKLERNWELIIILCVCWQTSLVVHTVNIMEVRTRSLVDTVIIEIGAWWTQ